MKSLHNFVGDFQSHHKLITDKRKYPACLAKLSSLLKKIQWVNEVLKHEIETLEKRNRKNSAHVQFRRQGLLKLIGSAWANSTLMCSMSSSVCMARGTVVHCGQHSWLSWSIVSCTVTATLCTYSTVPFYILHRTSMSSSETMIEHCWQSCCYLDRVTRTSPLMFRIHLVLLQHRLLL